MQGWRVIEPPCWPAKPFFPLVPLLDARSIVFTVSCKWLPSAPLNAKPSPPTHPGHGVPLPKVQDVPVLRPQRDPRRRRPRAPPVPRLLEGAPRRRGTHDGVGRRGQRHCRQQGGRRRRRRQGRPVLPFLLHLRRADELDGAHGWGDPGQATLPRQHCQRGLQQPLGLIQLVRWERGGDEGRGGGRRAHGRPFSRHVLDQRRSCHAHQLPCFWSQWLLGCSRAGIPNEQGELSPTDCSCAPTAQASPTSRAAG